MPRSLEVGHVLYVQAAGEFFRVANVREFKDLLSIVLTASQTLSNQELTTLKSPNDRIYHLRSMALEDDISFAIRFRQKSQIGIKTTQNLTIDDAPEQAPWYCDLWMYNYSPFYDVTENRGIAKTAIVQLNGEEYELESIGTQFKGAFSVVDG